MIPAKGNAGQLMTPDDDIYERGGAVAMILGGWLYRQGKFLIRKGAIRD